MTKLLFVLFFFFGIPFLFFYYYHGWYFFFIKFFFWYSFFIIPIYPYVCSFRILKNRESAAHLKQKKLQYMINLEHRINFVENENASIFEKIKLLEVKHITLATISLSCLNGIYKKVT